MTRKQRFVVGWIGVIACVGVYQAGHAHHREIVAGVIVGVTCVIIGSWL